MGKISLLVVDDMEYVYEIAKLKLSKKYNIFYASTKEKALELIEKNSYGLVVADYYLGKKAPKGGLEVVRAAIAKGLSSVLMSKENHRKEAEKEGARFIFKRNMGGL